MSGIPFEFLQALASGLPIGGAMAGGAVQGMQARAQMDQTYADMEMRRNADQRQAQLHPYDLDRVRQQIRLSNTQEDRAANDYYEGSQSLTEAGVEGNVDKAYTGVKPGTSVRQFTKTGGNLQADKAIRDRADANGGTAQTQLETRLWGELSDLSQALQAQDPKLALLMHQKGFEVLKTSRSGTAQALYNVIIRIQDLTGREFSTLPAGTSTESAVPIPPRGAAPAAPAPAQPAASPQAAPAKPSASESRTTKPTNFAEWERLKKTNPAYAAKLLDQGFNPYDFPDAKL